MKIEKILNAYIKDRIEKSIPESKTKKKKKRKLKLEGKIKEN